MAFTATWYQTVLPTSIIESFETDMKMLDQAAEESTLIGNVLDTDKRKSSNCWLSTNHWISGFVWHYIARANRENFQYDLHGFDNEQLQYTVYEEGDFYKWHVDGGIDTYHRPELVPSSTATESSKEQFVTLETEQVRKLSFSLLLSDPSEFEGGDLQFNNIVDNWKPFFAPKERGCLTIFDSRCPHRVLKVKAGVRKSLVGWVVGPRWR